MITRRVVAVACLIVLIAGVVGVYQTARVRAAAEQDAAVRKQLSGLAAPARRGKPISLRTDRP